MTERSAEHHRGLDICIVLALIAVAALPTWIIPARRYERRRNPFLLLPGVGCFARLQRALPGDAAPVAGSGRLGPGLRMNNRITTGIRAFMARDWQRARDFKDAYWAERIERLGPLEGLRIADELRQQAILENPDWPDAKSRREDLGSHIRLADLFARADAARRP